MKVFAYCRVSTETNKDGHGFTRQKDSINQWAKNNQSEVIEFFEEVFTGTEVERPVFAQMLEQMNAHGIKTFVVENQTRLGRDLMVNLHLIASCKKMGVGVIDASTGDDLTKQDDPMSVAMMQISGVFSQLEKSQLVSKLRKARDAKSKEHGKRIEGRKKITIPNDLILKIKQLRRKPIGKRRLTIKQVADALNIEGLLTPSGGKFHTTTVSRILKEI
ncbi:recombinase family protein [Verrucomicrobia bacterium]|nr:recombinase family protein [Verrucomicrobiota bacterium]